jgi:hypothetical protein
MLPAGLHLQVKIDRDFREEPVGCRYEQGVNEFSLVDGLSESPTKPIPLQNHCATGFCISGCALLPDTGCRVLHKQVFWTSFFVHSSAWANWSSSCTSAKCRYVFVSDRSPLEITSFSTEILISGHPLNARLSFASPYRLSSYLSFCYLPNVSLPDFKSIRKKCQG